MSRQLICSLPTAAVLAVAVSSFCAGSASADPSAWWRFDRAHHMGTKFKSVVGPDIPVVGTTGYVTDAQGESLALNNKSLTVVDVSSKAANILAQQNMTVSMWVALDKGQRWGGLVGVIQDNGDFERGWVLGYNEVGFSFGLTSAGVKRMTYLAGRTRFVPGRWYHVAATYDGATMKLYVNGVLDGQSIVQHGPILYPDGMPFVIGTYKDNNENFPMKGRIREVQLEKAVLSPQQIATQYGLQSALTQLQPVFLK